jgi:dTDP-4-amino-4,6-dideoxygalactose transaminase
MSTHAKLALFGGPPACPHPWPTWPVFDNRERQLLNAVLESGKWWYGERVREFEAAYAAFQGAKYAVSCTNGTTAIEMGLRALGVVEGDEVIVPPYSFVATASAVITIGAIPVFADIEPDSLNLDPGEVERRLTPRTRAIVPVHVGGRMADMDRLNALAARAGLRVLEDAAHAWGSQWDGRGAGTLGDCGTFSFQVSKNITAGEGGVLVTNHEELADLCRSFSHCGRRKNGPWYDHDFLGSNLRLTEFQAAVLLAQLERLPDQLARREANAGHLDAALAGIPGIRRLPPAARMTRRSYHMVILRVEENVLGISRDRFLEALCAEGVPASKGWYQPLYRNRVFQDAHLGPAHGIRSPLAAKGVRYDAVVCPVCERVCRDAIWISHQALLASESQVRQIADAVAKVVARAADLR